MADIFISYAREDRPRVEPIAKALEEQDWSVWWDPQIPPGKTFIGVIKDALDAAKCVVVLWSKQSIDSEWVLEEANFGKRRGILVPAKIDPVEPPLGFGLIQAANLTNWDGDTRHAQFEGLLTAISGIVGPPRQPEKDDQVANIFESRLEQPSEVPHDEGRRDSSIDLTTTSIGCSQPHTGSQDESTAASESKLTGSMDPGSHKTSNVVKFGILVGLALLLTAGIWWWVFRFDAKETAPVTSKVSLRLRSEPRTVPSEEADETFGLNKNGRPIKYIENQFEDRGKVVFDRATGLMWQKSGSQNSLTYEKAQKYIEQLNREGFAGHSEWRLPTIPELMSLLTPQKQANGLYIDPIFDADQGWCWSTDKQSSGSTWGVYFSLGFVYWNVLNYNDYVRGVRS